MVIRPATVLDARAVCELVIGTGRREDTPCGGVAVTFPSVLNRPDLRALVAVDETTVIGYVELHVRPSLLRGAREGWVAVLAVAPTRKGNGIDRRLLEAIEREAELLGCRTMVLGASEPRTVARSASTLEDRFLGLAARAASAVQSAITGLEDRPSASVGADGAPTEAADRAAEHAAAELLSALGVPLVSEESGILGSQCPTGQPWICIDPLDGSRNFRAGLAPYATAFGLVLDGHPIAGYVCDLSSGRRWWAAHGAGAWVDGRPARPRPQPIAMRPSPEPGEPVAAVDGYARVRISGSTTVDLCRVADGTVGAFVDLDRGVVHVHDLAGPLAVLLEAGAAIASPDDDVELVPDPARHFRLVAAWSQAEAVRLAAPRSIRG